MTKAELVENIKNKKSFLCVGLDPDLAKLPSHLGKNAEAVYHFNKAIIDATAPYAVSYKLNIAFYECLGIEGWKVFEDTVRYIKEKYPDQFIIADAKRGDIGNTSKMYAKTFFEEIDVDAVTVAPYMGSDSVKPFLGYPGKWVILLALTSNPGASDFQMLKCENGKFLYENVITEARSWADDDALMFVVGATRGEQLKTVRDAAPQNFLLIPGVGAQGGSLEDVAKYAMNAQVGVLVNSSRGIIYASANEDFAEASANAAKDVRDQMAIYL